jgi:hypothetical protein
MTYEVDVEGFGVILKQADSIEEARSWANHAFPRRSRTVKRHREYKLCERCDSRPCCCETRTERRRT